MRNASAKEQRLSILMHYKWKLNIQYLQLTSMGRQHGFVCLFILLTLRMFDCVQKALVLRMSSTFQLTVMSLSYLTNHSLMYFCPYNPLK
jgi:hypothetical protein